MPVINKKNWQIINPRDIRLNDIIRFIKVGEINTYFQGIIIGLKRKTLGVYLEYKGCKGLGFIRYNSSRFITQRKIK